MFFVGMSDKTYPGSTGWLIEACREAGFAQKSSGPLGPVLFKPLAKAASASMKISSSRECGNFRLRAKSMSNRGAVNPTRLRRRFVNFEMPDKLE